MPTAAAQWLMFNEVLRRQALMDDMIERCGIDMLALIHSDRGQSFAEARAKCRLCLRASACREWLLARRDGPIPPPDFCPNASLFRMHLNQH
jgi:hypothetical protein